MNMNFNDESTKPQFMYKRNPLVPHAFQIFMMKKDKGEYEPVGDYTLLDLKEDSALTEKKVMNIISLLNGRKNLIDLGPLTNCKVFFSIVHKEDEGDPDKIIFRNHDGNGPSTENAILILEKGVLDASQFKDSI